MSAALVLLPAVDDDGAPLAAWTEQGNLHTMTRERARQLTDRTREAIVEAGANLVELRAGSAHLALGYAHWHEYVEREFGDLMVWRLVRDRVARVAERQALVASLTLAGYTVREQRETIGAALATIHADQRAQGLVPDRPLPAPADDVVDAEVLDPLRGLSPRWAALAMVEAQGERGLTALELVDQLECGHGTAPAALSKLDAAGFVVLGSYDERRRNRRPYRITELGRARLAELLAARDAAER